MKLTTKQQNIIDHLRSTGTGFTDAWHGFDARTVNSLVKKGLVERVTVSRFREDDREMVYWTEFRLVKTGLEKALA
jgi:hypothetical protein